MTSEEKFARVGLMAALREEFQIYRRTKGPSHDLGGDHFTQWMCGWASVLDGAVRVLTFGYIRPGFEWKILCARVEEGFRRAEKAARSYTR